MTPLGGMKLQHGMCGGHPRGEGQRSAALQGADRLLQRLPGGVAVAAVSDRGIARVVGADIGGGKNHGRIQRSVHRSLGRPAVTATVSTCNGLTVGSPEAGAG